jgi:WD40 repeat protein
VPEPVTTPSTWSGAIAFSRDGSRMAFASADWRSTLLKVAFDPKREAIDGAPTAVLRSTRPIRDHELSPDGQWVAYTESSPQEDILVARTDGSQYRRLTDDNFRDRGPTWSPDGQRLAFYSDRSGTYEVWTIRPDGSGLARITSMQLANFPIWSPDGRRLAVSGVGLSGGWFTIDSHANAAPPPPLEPAMDGKRRFWPFSWSDPDHVTGVVLNADATLIDLATYSVTSHQYHVVPDAARATWQVAASIADTTLLIARDTQGISVVHADTGARRSLISVGGYAIGRSVGVSRDGRWITYTETGIEGDIWLATLSNK